MLHTVCCNNVVRLTAVGLAATVRRLSISYVTDTRVDLRRAYVTYSQKWQNCTLQPGEDHDVYFGSTA